MSLKDWLRSGWLVETKISPREIQDLLRIIERDLAQSRIAGLDTDWQLNIAYNAVLQLGVIAIAASGYRTKGEAHHYRVIQSLAHTIKAEADIIIALDGFRKKRHTSEYDRSGSVSEQEVKELREMAEHLRNLVLCWLNENHPELSNP